MIVGNIFIVLWAIIMILILFFKIKKDTKKAKIMVRIALIIFILDMVLPRQAWGEWNAIKSLNGKKMKVIMLQPNLPDWKVNLTDTTKFILEASTIDSIIHLLRKSDVVIFHHPTGIWETKLSLISTTNDTLILTVWKTHNNGTIINDSFRNDRLGDYLNTLMNFREAVYGKGATHKN